jgi:hypothetical protein
MLILIHFKKKLISKEFAMVPDKFEHLLILFLITMGRIQGRSGREIRRNEN